MSYLWADRTPHQQGQPYPTPPMPTYRSSLDRARAGRTPDAEYPSGYLGTKGRDRRNIMGRPGRRQNTKDYNQGVHHGSKMREEAYYWPPWMAKDRGVRAVGAGVRQRPMVEFDRQRLTVQGKPTTGRPQSALPPPARWP